ncbi:ABC transporter substrate-binding protein [Bacillus sp. JCM 19034]|uniref:ABC transporter substrate-binding protein n=1 Tax=Bacillus sp. JCM 19034 TaxID=1481928 RepID=UPI0007866CC3|nr:extracellular solute-binding protein [Bacillus sp. JCM 19034]
MKKIILLTLLSIALLTGCGDSDADSNETASNNSDVTTIEFFQVKPEAVQTFNELIEKFEGEYPNIKVEQNTVPDGMTVLKTRFSANDIPDVFITYPVEADYVLRANNDYLLDITDEPFIEKVNKEIQDRYIENDRMYGVALSLNANGVLYNKEIFEKHGVEVPESWDELLTVMETLQEAGEVPVIMGNQNPDQTSIFNLNFIAQEFDADYWESLNAGNETIVGDPRWEKAAQKMLDVLQYAQDDHMGTDYDQGNTMFANGDGAMYFMGAWVLPTLREMNPNFDNEFGYFPFPQTNNPGENITISGVDVGLSIAANTEYPEESLKFVEFLIDEAQTFADLDGSFSAVEGVEISDSILQGLLPQIESGQVANWPNHYWAGGTAAEADFRSHSQNFFIHQDINQFLQDIEEMFASYRQ